ncbi:hypothetical protein PybrP1_010533 [[Pythium] brassicae (nom. inval.)]|nr:hypothetical protein PybrP1_010533 [[Pythium] brassicae (nom. inval.)]
METVPSPAAASTGGSPVAAVSFSRLDCEHAELFQSEYKRSNRTKGLKILRCFPHCCPNHMDRSYCGSSLHVIMRTTKALAPEEIDERQPESLALGKLAVLARFESVTDPGLEIGEGLAFEAVTANMQSEENPEGQWIPGIRERTSAATSSNRNVSQVLPPENELVFELNGKIYSRWYYDWESGANKAQRRMKHVLKAYVFEKCAVDDNGNLVTSFDGTRGSPPIQSLLYRVVAVIVSPEFTVISYRRAPSEGLGVKGDSHHASQYSGSQHRAASSAPSHNERLKRPLGATDAHVKEDRWGDDAAATPTSEPEPGPASYLNYPHSHFYSGPADPRSMKRRRPTDSFVRPAAASQRLPHAPTSQVAPPPPLPPPPSHVSLSFSSASSHPTTSAFEDRVLWEHAHADAVTSSKNLALLYWFAQWTPLATYAPFADELAHIMHRRLLEPLAPMNLPVVKLNCFSRVVQEQADRAATPTGGLAALPFELESLLRVVAQASLWFYSEATRQWLRAFVQQHAPDALDKHALRASFLVWVGEAEERLNHHVFVMTPLRSLANVAEEIIAAVYSNERFQSKRPRVRQILSSHGFAGWTAFVAQLRDAYIGSCFSTRRSGAPRSGSALPQAGAAAAASSGFLQTAVARNAFEHRWNNEWLLDTEEAVWKQSEPGIASAASLFTLFDLISQLARVEIALGVQERTLRIRSTTTLAPGTDSMHLVLDGRDRVFRVFPNGVSTSTTAGCMGDYIGSIHLEGKDRLVVYLELFHWAAAATDRSHHVRMRVECWRNHRLYVNGEVLASVSTPSLVEEEHPFLGEMGLRAKRKSVSRAHARQYQAAVPGARASLPPAWQPLGRFRLSYHCLGR